MSTPPTPRRTTLEQALLDVCAAVNLDPRSVTLDPGFGSRMRRKPPSFRALRGVQALLVHLGLLEGDPDAVDDGAAATALTALPLGLRSQVEELVVTWDDGAGASHAAAFAVDPDRTVGRLLARSWVDPTHWDDPMVDVSRPLLDVLEDAIDHVRQTIGERTARRDFDAALLHATRVVGVALTVAGGEGPEPGGQPHRSADDRAWAAWLVRFEASARDEWRRLHGTLAAERVRLAAPVQVGDLTGTRVFLSYARPDATGLAWPALEALRAAGADVWFDQDQDLDQGFLDEGLATAIAGCEGFVLCASDEFFERAGYATQEVAWALETQRRRHSAGRRHHAAVVTRSTPLLPTALAAWPVVGLRDGLPVDALSEHLVAALSASRTGLPVTAAQGGRAAPPASPVEGTDVVPLPPQADPEALLARVRHDERWRELPGRAVSRLAATSDRDAQERIVAAKLRDVGAGLDWDGHLVGWEQWPDDALLRAYRWLLGTSRVVASIRWPLSGDLDDPDDVADDLELLATAVPVVDWSPGPTWADEERRYSIRYHLGSLRVAEGLLGIGAYGGVVAHLDRLAWWQAGLRTQRQRCIDALLDLRVRRRVSWRSDPPTWDLLYRSWHGWLTRVPADAPVPDSVLLAVAVVPRLLAAAAAQVTWQAVRTGDRAQQSILAPSTGGTASPLETCRVWAASRGAPPVPAPEPGRWLSLGTGPDAHGAPAVHLDWHGFGSSAPSGQAVLPAPDAVAQALKAANV